MTFKKELTYEEFIDIINKSSFRLEDIKAGECGCCYEKYINIYIYNNSTNEEKNILISFCHKHYLDLKRNIIRKLTEKEIFMLKVNNFIYRWHKYAIKRYDGGNFYQELTTKEVFYILIL